MFDEVILKSGLQVYFESHGSGVPVVCIPGWAYTAEVFSRNLKVLGEHYRAISYDPRSHGRSEVTHEGNDYVQHGRDLHEFLAALGLREFILMGWSFGVYTAYAYLDQFGFDGVKALISVDESPKVIKTHEGDWGENFADPIEGLIQLVGSESYLDFFRDYMAAGFVRTPDEALLNQFTDYAASLTPGMAAALLQSGAQSDYSELAIAAATKIPVLNIVREDWATEAVNWIRANQPEAEVKVLGAHLMLYEFAEDFNEYVLDFLKPFRC